MESSQFSKLAQSILELDRSLDRLRDIADRCGVPSPEHQDWYALLKYKLIPQLSEKALLVVAVAGGTNTGKSLVFNHLAGEHFSAVDHRASGTKHPVCLVPASVGEASTESVLARHFDAFRLVPWSDADQPLAVSETNHLFWAVSPNVSERLLLLDTPDIDSDRQVNWERARAIRHAADVLIAVLTEQKYNDAAVRRFFREAVEAEKPIIVLFNMFDREADADHLVRWLGRFREETGAEPVAVIVAPHDRQRAESLALPFYSVSEDGRLVREEPVDLATLLSELHFDAIKSQTLLGALKVLNNPVGGVRAYVDSIESTARRFDEALRALENIGEASVDWPGLPTYLLVEEIRSWWHQGRPGWSKNINETYRKIGSGLLWPIRKAAEHVSSRYFGTKISSGDPLEEFRLSENRAVFGFVEKMVRRLEQLAETDNPVLRRELLELTGGERRAALVDRAHRILESMEPVDSDFRTLLYDHLTRWSEKNPQAVGWGRSLDNAATVARPVITVTLAATGFALGAQVVGQVVGEVAMAGGVTAGGEALIHAGGEGAKRGTAKLFRQIQEEYVLGRSKRFYEKFRDELWKDVIDRLRTGAEIVRSDAFLHCKQWDLPSGHDEFPLG